MNDWISVDERLPEGGKGVFLLSKHWGVRDGVYNDIEKSWVVYTLIGRLSIGNRIPDITHWQPKTYPKPPEPESKKQTCGTCTFWDFNGPEYSCGCRQCKIDSDIKAPNEAACGAWKEKTDYAAIISSLTKRMERLESLVDMLEKWQPKEHDHFGNLTGQILRQALRQ